MKNYYFDFPDILVFPVIDWPYRFQRPQHISTQLAAHGHRVFYFRTYFLHGTQPMYQSIRDDIPIFDVQFGLLVPKDNNADQLDTDSKDTLLDQVDLLREKFNILKAVCFVDLPFWTPVVMELQKKYAWKVFYNSMDHLGGFSNVTSYMLEPEDELIKNSDLVLTTSRLLFNEKSRLNSKCILVPNGTDFNHFNYSSRKLPDELIDMGKPIIGYYGAISDWLDTELIYNLASARPNWKFVLIGRLESADVSRIREMSNVFLLGEKPYELLPEYLQHFDVCIIPFKKSLLTEATNPVKLFEYLSAGKPIVATDLNELRYYQEYVRLASSVGEWLEAIEHALGDYSPTQVAKRLSFARQNTWDERMLSIEDAILSRFQDQGHTSTPLPLILPDEYLVSSRLLTCHDGADYWSLVYEKDNVVYKQTSYDLAEREARFLSRFESDYFPQFIEARSEGGYSIITFGKSQLQNLHDALPLINASVTELYTFIFHCLNMLVLLQAKAVTHRNICRENILMRGGRPILQDFGWAVSEHEPYFTPLGLGGYERPSDGCFSDVYSMGKIFEYVNRPHYRPFDWVISLMTMNDASLRITDLSVLKTLFNTALQIALKESEG